MVEWNSLEIAVDEYNEIVSKLIAIPMEKPYKV